VARATEQPVKAEKAAVPVSAPPAQPSHEEPPKRKVETVSQTPAPKPEKLEKPEKVARHEKAKKAAKPEKKAKPARPAKAAAARKKTAEPKVKAKARAAVKPAPKRPAKKAKE
jgi:hypothetical protein